MSKTKPFLILLLLLCSFRQLIAQEYSYVQYNTQNGLAGSTVYDAVQDKDGFIWFATESGVSRFDGTNFKNFTTKDGLPDDEVLKLFVDSKNRVWMIPFNKTVCYYEKGRFHTQTNDSVLMQLHLKNELVAIAEDIEGNILFQETTKSTILTTKKTFVYRSSNIPKAIIFFGGKNSGPGFKIAEARPYSLRIYQVTNWGQRFVKVISFPTNVHGLTQQGILSDEWEIFKIEDSLKVYSCIHNSSYGIKVSPDVISFSALNDSVFFMNTRNGTFSYDYKSNLPIEHFLPNHSISSVFKDREGSYWFTTFEDGVYRLSNTDIKIFQITKNSSLSLPVYSIHQNKEKVFFGLNNVTFCVLDKKKGKVTDSIFLKKLGGRIMSIKTSDITRSFFIGTDQGLLRLSNKKESILLYSKAIKSLRTVPGGLLAACNSNAFVYDLTKRKENVFFPERATVAFANGNDYYIGTTTGLYVRKEGQPIQYLGDKFAILKNRITDGAVDSQKVIWVATDGNGLLGIDGEKIVYTINTTGGLSSNNCKSLYCQGNDIWVGTDKGLNKVTPMGNHWNIIKFDINDGFPSNIINAICADGTMIYVGTPKGLIYFDERKINKESLCLLKLLKISAKEEDITGLSSKISIRKKETINFEFVGISFKSAGDISYHYKLEGFDTTWKETNQTSLHFLSLPAGDYTLHLKAINKFGVQSNTISYSFTVEKDFFEKTWVRILLLAVFILFTWIIARAVLNRTRKLDAEKMQTQERILQLEQMALRSQMNPHFIFNSLNSIQQFVIDKDIAGANKYISSFSRLIRQTLDNSSKERISLAEEISYLTNYLQLEKTRTEDAFEYIFTIDNTVATDEISIPPMLLQPYIENAIRHGIRYRKDKKGKIDINISIQENNLICIITDNGIGRKLSQSYKGSRNIEYQSKGTALTAERINIINTSQEEKIEVLFEDLEDTHGEPLGTRVFLRFPIEKK